MIENAPLITVVIPTYNRSQEIIRAVQSVRKQNYENWELFIVDDGSTDNTKDSITEKYAQDPRIIFAVRPYKRKKGASACRNFGAERGKGKYIAFLDSDDEWLPFHLEYKLQILNNSEAEFNFGAFLKQRENICVETNCHVEKDITNIESYLISKKADVRTSTFLLNRKSFLSVKFDEDLGKHQDWDFALRFCRDRKFVVNHKPTVKMYLSHDRMSSRRDHEATMLFLEKHRSKLDKSTHKVFLTNVGLRTYIAEGNNSAFKKYSRKLREMGGLGDLRYFLVAYIFSIPFLNLFLRTFIKSYTTILRWSRSINRPTFL